MKRFRLTEFLLEPSDRQKSSDIASMRASVGPTSKRHAAATEAVNWLLGMSSVIRPPRDGAGKQEAAAHACGKVRAQHLVEDLSSTLGVTPSSK